MAVATFCISYLWHNIATAHIQSAFGGKESLLPAIAALGSMMRNVGDDETCKAGHRALVAGAG